MNSSVQQQLLKVLERIDRPGTFCASGRLPSTLPGLQVAGAGTIALPLEKRQAAALKKLAHQAPYGKGTRTLVDTNVRRVWELDAGQVALANPEWPAVVTQAIETVQSTLGLEKQKLEAYLYKLLLYERGSFFLPHRDGEKLDRMVATLVIALPSLHEGGELIVRHEGQEEIVDFSPQSGFQTQFAAFYADCEHEIRPVTSGFRLALVYNLTLAKSKSSIAAPTNRAQIAEAVQLLSRWSSQRRAAPDANGDSVSSKMAALLDHQYSQAGLTRDALKGIDRARADVLFAAAREAGCDASLALVTYWESGSAEPPDYGRGYGYRRRRRYGGYDDDKVDGDIGEGRYVMGEVFDSSLTAEHFSDAEGNPLSFGRIPLNEEEIVSLQPLNTGEPDKEDFEGYTGNAGMTLERWYHRAAVVLWPAKSRFDVLCEAGVNAAVGGLDQMIRSWKRAKPDEQASLKSSCLEFAGRIIAHWREHNFASGYYAGDVLRGDKTEDDDSFDDDDFEEDGNFDEDDFDDEKYDEEEDDEFREEAEHGNGIPPRSLLALLNDLGEARLIAAWILRVLKRDVSIHPGQALGDACEQYGWLTFQHELRELFGRTDNETIERHTQLLADFSLRKDKRAERRELCASLARQLVSALEQWDPQSAKRDWRAKSVDLSALLPLLTQTLLGLEEPQLLERFVTFILDRPKSFDWTTVQIPTLLRLEAWLKRNVKRAVVPLHRWFAAIVAELESRVSEPPREPENWRRESATGCSCADCKELSRFLNDPDKAALRLPLAEQRRSHLHRVIDGKKLDTTHVTERRGRPYTLVCTKTKASYERALKAHHMDLEHLAKIRKLAEWHEALKSDPVKSKGDAPKPKKRR
jgi:hypothetical protein